MRQRARRSQAYSDSEGSGHYTSSDIMAAARDVKSWVHGMVQIAVVTILYGFGTFLPIIIRDGFNFSTKQVQFQVARLCLRVTDIPLQAQYLVIPVNIWGAIVYAIGAYLSDRYQARFLPLVLTVPIGILGYAILLSPVTPYVQYFATYLIATACFLCTGGNITWLSVNCAPDGKRAASLGILLTLTNIGGVVSGQIYQSNAAPNYTLGHAWSLGCLGFAWLGWWVMRGIYVSREREKDVRLEDGYERTIGGAYTDREIQFRYQI